MASSAYSDEREDAYNTATELASCAALFDTLEDPAIRPRDKIKAAEALLDRGFVHRDVANIDLPPFSRLQLLLERADSRCKATP